MDTFLPPEAPPSASAHRIDFATTSPPIPAYANSFAAVIDNILTEAECNELIRLAEASTVPPNDTAATPTWERAMINAGNGKQTLATDTRNCGRIMLDSFDLADKLLSRMMPFLQELGIDREENKPFVKRGKVYKLSRLNERLRFLRYEGGEYFRPHWDAMYMTPDGKERSFYTIHLYLNGEGEQDLEELRKEEERVASLWRQEGDSAFNRDINGKLLGGATSFFPRYEQQDVQVRVFPKAGSVLVFQHRDLLHSGDSVFQGVKYTMRTDIMYREE